MLDGLPTDFPETDKARRNTICNLLSEWGLLKLKEPIRTKDPVVPISYLKILPFGEKNNWELIPKYNIGRKKINYDTYDPDSSQ
jgi:hypothetical protein